MIKINNKIFKCISKVFRQLPYLQTKEYRNTSIFTLSLIQQFSEKKGLKPHKHNDLAKQKVTTTKEKSKQVGQKQPKSTQYGQQINELLKKKQLTEIDLVFLSKLLQMKDLSIKDEEKVIFLKKQIKKLTYPSCQNLLSLIQLSQKIGVIHYSSSLIRGFIAHFINLTIHQEKIRDFPITFLKQASFLLFLQSFQKNAEQGAEVLKTFATLLSNQQLKKVDNICCQSIKSMQINTVVRFLNIFRQISRKGLFAQLAGHIIMEKKEQLSNKYLLMALISLFELGCTQNMQKLEPLVINRIGGQNSLEHKEVLAVLQVFHKFKKGGANLWQNLQKFIKARETGVVFQHSFAILSGLTRNYVPRPSLLFDLIMLEPTFDFVKELNQKQFIQFFLVLYFHFQHLQPSQTRKIEPFIIQAIKSKQMKSVYFEIQNFFLFLFQNGSQKKEHLRKSYPNDMMVTLVSLAYSIQETSDITDLRAYQQDLSSRYTKEVWERNKKTIVADLSELERNQRTIDVKSYLEPTNSIILNQNFN